MGWEGGSEGEDICLHTDDARHIQQKLMHYCKAIILLMKMENH